MRLFFHLHIEELSQTFQLFIDIEEKLVLLIFRMDFLIEPLQTFFSMTEIILVNLFRLTRCDRRKKGGAVTSRHEGQNEGLGGRGITGKFEMAINNYLSHIFPLS